MARLLRYRYQLLMGPFFSIGLYQSHGWCQVREEIKPSIHSGKCSYWSKSIVIASKTLLVQVHRILPWPEAGPPRLTKHMPTCQPLYVLLLGSHDLGVWHQSPSIPVPPSHNPSHLELTCGSTTSTSSTGLRNHCAPKFRCPPPTL